MVASCRSFGYMHSVKDCVLLWNMQVQKGKFQTQNPPRVHQLNKPLTPLCLDCTNLGLRFNQSELRLHSVSKQEVKLCKSYDQFEYLVGHWHLYLKFRTVLPLRLTHSYPVARGNHHPVQNDTAHCQSDLQKLENMWLLSVLVYIYIYIFKVHEIVVQEIKLICNAH